jgi:sialidase-1
MLIIAAAAIMSTPPALKIVHEGTVFRKGEAGYDTFRIPSLSTLADGTVLAICEGRNASSSDTGDIDLVMKSSSDNGRTWSELSVIWDDGPNTCGNPCVVVDPFDGKIHLLSTHNLGSDHESAIISRDSVGTRTIWTLTSEDNGKTWTKPRHITKYVKQLDWTWYATGPGTGIVTSEGRLVIPCDHIEAVTRKYFSHVIYSDDHGATWKLGGSTPTDQVNECEVVELSDGRLHLNMRNYERKTTQTRAVSISDDGGLTWGPITREGNPVEPRCQASIRRWTDDLIAFSNPASPNQRVKMTLRLSADDGETWDDGLVLFEGPSAYSSLSVLKTGEIACFFEKGNGNPYETISVSVIAAEN